MSSGGVTLGVAIAAAMGSLGLGALVGAIVAHVLRERAEKKRAERERDGLLRVLYTEIFLNQRMTEFLHFMYLGNKAKVALEVGGKYTYTDAWEATRVKLAQYLPSREFSALAFYHQSLFSLQDFIENYTEYAQEFDVLRVMLNRLNDQHAEVENIIRTYVPDVEGNELTEEYAEYLFSGKKE